tara:strand:- start:1557 stop:1727 length:171 start_codon:yes stop_codon:yes gene_type:complete
MRNREPLSVPIAWASDGAVVAWQKIEQKRNYRTAAGVAMLLSAGAVLGWLARGFAI